MNPLSSLTRSSISRRRLVQGAATLGVGASLVPSAGRLQAFAQDARNSVVWVSPRGTLEVLDDYGYWEGARRAVGVAVEAADPGRDHLGHLGHRRERALVGRQLDRRIQAEAREDLGRREPRLVPRDGLEP